MRVGCPLSPSPSLGCARVQNKSIVCRDRTAGWSDEKAHIVSDLNFEIQPSTFTIIIGSVGCDKSTFLVNLFGETPVQEGYLRLSQRHVAFCAQKAWLTNTILKRNIAGESPYEDRLYKSIIRACALEPDLEAL